MIRRSESTIAVQRSGATLWSIQYLRAFAAIGVVVSHQMQMRSAVFQLGEHGVDMFFAISGFIMVALTDRRKVTPLSFMLDRIARIVPPYWIATAAAILASALGLHFYHASSDLAHLSKSLLFIPAFNHWGKI